MAAAVWQVWLLCTPGWRYASVFYALATVWCVAAAPRACSLLASTVSFDFILVVPAGSLALELRQALYMAVAVVVASGWCSQTGCQWPFHDALRVVSFPADQALALVSRGKKPGDEPATLPLGCAF